MSDQHPEIGPVPEIGPSGAIAPPPTPVKPRTPRRKIVLTAMAGVLAIGALGFGIVSLTEGDGADSAEEAVENLFEAVDRQDAIGAAEALEPTERRILVDALEETAEQAERVKVTDGDLDLRSVGGVDLSVDGLRMHATELDDETVAVDIDSGTISSRAQLSKMPIGPVIQEVIDRSEQAGDEVDDTEDDQIELAGTRLVAVERGGGWYVSALFSFAEQIRLDGDPVAAYPQPGTAIPAKGADSPEAAVREGVAAAVGVDIRRLIELTPNDEARVLHTYGPILVDEAKDSESNITVDDLELEVTDAPGGRKRVRATSMTMTWESEWDRQVTTYDGRCSSTTYEYLDPEEYGFEEGEDTGGEWTWCEDDTTRLAPYGIFNIFYSPASLDVIVEERGGRWFLSPTGTVVANTVDTLAGLDGDEVRRIVRSWSGEWWIYQPSEFWEACGVTEPSLDTPRDEAEAAYEECIESLPEDYAGPWGPSDSMGLGTGSGPISSTSYPGDECYAQTSEQYDPAAIEACLADLVAAGELDPEQLALFRCESVYDEIPYDESMSDEELDDLYAEAEDAFEACMQAFDEGQPSSGGGVSFESEPEQPSATTSTTRPAPSTPTTTRPPATTTTTRPPATTSTTAG